MNTNQVLSEPYTILTDRIMWFDGDSSYTVNAMREKILNGSRDWTEDYVIDAEEFSIKRINELNPDVNLREKEIIHIPDDSFNWNIPDKYLNLDIKTEITSKLMQEFSKRNFSIYDEQLRLDRVDDEFILWEQIGMLKLLNVLIYLVDSFEQNSIVWGTGRGSSCCSYILYLIGIHDVDSVKYNIETTDFFRT